MWSLQSNAEDCRSLDPRIDRYLSERREAGPPVRNIERLVGDASARSYYRLLTGEGSLVLALLPGPLDPSTSPFLNVARLFREIPVRVPRIHDVCGPEGIMLLEDLGDDLLQLRAAAVRPAEKASLYREAISILVRLQRRGAELRDERYIPFRIAFDEQKFLEELRFFEHHFLGGIRKAKLTVTEREAVDDGFRQIAGRLARLPKVLCHRDYHCRNLMVSGGELVVIDFQDARMGPASYDLVSLVRDSYLEHDPDFVAEMVEEFCRGVDCRYPDEEIDLVSLQRNLKALGTFGYQISVRGLDVYRQYVPITLGLVRANLVRNCEWDGLRKPLAAHIPELA